MAVCEILIYPQHKQDLRKKSKLVSRFGRKTRRLIRDLKDTLQVRSDGIGLAAPQIGKHQRVAIACLGEEREGKWEAGIPFAFVNPQILETANERKDIDGCLSLPGLYGLTTRPHYLRVTGLNEEGQPFDQTFLGFNAVVVHHEIDHLDGVLFIDRIERLEDLCRIAPYEKQKKVYLPMPSYM
jgi:peptide deformylase